MYNKVLVLLICIFLISCGGKNENDNSYLLPKDNYVVLNINDLKKDYKKLEKLKEGIKDEVLENFSQFDTDLIKDTVVILDHLQNIGQVTFVVNKGENKDLPNFSLILDSKENITQIFLKKFVELYNKKNTNDSSLQYVLPKKQVDEFVKSTDEKYKEFTIKKYANFYSCFAKGKNFIYSSKKALQNSLDLLGKSSKDTLANNDEFNAFQKKYGVFASVNIVPLVKLYDDKIAPLINKNPKMVADVLTPLGIREMKSLTIGLQSEKDKINIEGSLSFKNKKGILNLFPTKSLDANNLPKLPKGSFGLTALSLDLQDFAKTSYDIVQKITIDDIKDEADSMIDHFKKNEFDVEAIVNSLKGNYYFVNCGVVNSTNKDLEGESSSMGNMLFIFEIKNRDIFDKLLKSFKEKIASDTQVISKGAFEYFSNENEPNFGVGIDGNFLYCFIGDKEELFFSLEKRENHKLFELFKESVKEIKPFYYGVFNMKSILDSFDKKGILDMYDNFNINYSMYLDTNSINFRTSFSFKEK